MNVKERLPISDYNKYVKQQMPKSKTALSCVKAFFAGGVICTLGQAIRVFASDVLLLDQDGVAAFTCTVLIFLAALLTALGVYDVIGRFAGAGSIVPITGFSNSVVSPAMEFKREGFILGVGAKMFTIAGPVLVYGISSSILVGVIYYIVTLLGGA